jgi:hypothetical protein
MDDLMHRQAEIIEQVGWAVMHVSPAAVDPDTVVPFSYTVGLTAHDYPELLLSGLPLDAAHPLLNDLARRVYDKAQRFSDGERITDLIAGYDAMIIDGRPTDELIPGMAFARYGRDRVRLQQMVWPDRHGRFPWEHGYLLASDAQPLIANLRTGDAGDTGTTG